MIVFGSRGSDLALAQTRAFAETLAARTGTDYRIDVLETRGDRELDRPLPEIGGKGLFTAELEQALLEGRIDAAVHSLKDLPVEDPAGLTLGAVPERADPRDVLVYDPAAHDDEGGSVPLRDDARIGTSSPRWRGALLCLKPLLDVVDLRGNVPTRIGRVAGVDVKKRSDDTAAPLAPERKLDATLLAAAGLARLEAGGVDLARAGLDRVRVVPLDPSRVPPAPGQGALAVQCRAGDRRVLDLLAAVDHAPTRAAADAERRVLAALGGGCSMPFGALAEGVADSAGGGVRLRAGLFSAEDVRPAGAVFVDVRGATLDEVVAEATRRLSPFAGEPLKGRRIAVLRPAGGDGRLDGGLRVAGATLEGLTTSEIEPAFPEPGVLQEGLRDGILVFSSARAVDRFFEITAFEDELLARIRRIYAVGTATAEAVRARGHEVRCPTGSAGGAALADWIAAEADRPVPGSRILHPGAEEPHPAVADGLRGLDLEVVPAPVYRLVPFDEVDPPDPPVDAALFTSPSSVQVWCASSPGAPAPVTVALGPSTSSALAAAGLPATVVLTRPDPAELVRSLAERLA